ncbi:Undecaprenyl-phosphate galactose phosphotransferase, WbaP/exopolysaccharide biosynthesis polyprenyl glycosylphosphotransferase [Deinococcus reticulitermitis]|uniref:Undecaprenyl-phosphate galactose phosphotransferase, WbaP/exopolysaccharide biosynthesis polyprenyl glycosylphosphotransferase n=1 Tax=Deinococcus reticulitermitis TaxID=856736 RepID=A0A1H6ZPH6_9DEIO|nr:undecaprenyl-phosphate galactose phosphotransferase WbaP [Deinococcus reticulitermitis]SEJ54576.1 Undecaprenyl-phosphate galactose phosphotransferase, WbaP/exopolysaccharide biosynthesis polyprenyl glycosylphosphotransferase [Deinococcus reticulitermitis]
MTDESRVAQQQTRSLRLMELPQAFLLIAGDVASGLLAAWLAAVFVSLTGRPALGAESTLIWVAVWVALRAYQGLYPGYGKSPQTELRLHTVGTLQLLGAQLAAAFAIQEFVPSALGIGIQWVLTLVLALLVRYALRAFLIRSGRFGRDISIIGAGQTAAIAIGHLRANPAYGLRPLIAYDDNSDLQGHSIEGVPIVGSIEDALRAPRTMQALISIPGARAEVQQRLVNGVYAAFPFTWVIPDLFGVPNQALQPHNIGNVASLEIRNNLRSVQARFTKQTIDLLGAGVGTLLISPLLLMIALAIRLDSPGPVVYRARRLGRGGLFFDCFKFRSMHRDAEAKLQEVLAADPALRAEFEATHKLRDDPRVTRVGAFLRRTSLDELPQLLNVLRGEMSLVGPRPIVQAEVEKYGDIYAIYKQVRPGMTGYWQANGRSDTSYGERVAMDQFYVTNWTPWLDVVVLIQTVRVAQELHLA